MSLMSWLEATATMVFWMSLFFTEAIFPMVWSILESDILLATRIPACSRAMLKYSECHESQHNTWGPG